MGSNCVADSGEERANEYQPEALWGLYSDEVQRGIRPNTPPATPSHTFLPETDAHTYTPSPYTTTPIPRHTHTCHIPPELHFQTYHLAPQLDRLEG